MRGAHHCSGPPPRLRNDLYCVEWDVKLYYTILYYTYWCLCKGISAQEIHLCGEESGIDFIRQIAMVTGDDMEVRKYKRLTNLTVLDRAVGKILETFSEPL